MSSIKDSLIGSDMSKMILFMFLGLVIAILVLGFHKSPPASPAAGAAEFAQRQGLSSPSVQTAGQNSAYIEKGVY